MIHKKSLAENRMCKDCNWVQLFHRRFLGFFEYKSVRRNYLCWESFITRFPLSHCRLNSADKSLAKWRSLSHEANFRVLSILQTDHSNTFLWIIGLASLRMQNPHSVRKPVFMQLQGAYGNRQAACFKNSSSYSRRRSFRESRKAKVACAAIISWPSSFIDFAFSPR